MKRIALVAALVGAVVFASAGSVTTAHASGSVTAAHASSISRANAVRMAKNYLRYQAFSRTGLIKQLKYEGFSTSDATYGVSRSGANWYAQAAKKAKQYLKYQAFSRTGLIEQLEYEGFTPSQALLRSASRRTLKAEETRGARRGSPELAVHSFFAADTSTQTIPLLPSWSAITVSEGALLSSTTVPPAARAAAIRCSATSGAT